MRELWLQYCEFQRPKTLVGYSLFIRQCRMQAAANSYHSHAMSLFSTQWAPQGTKLSEDGLTVCAKTLCTCGKTLISLGKPPYGNHGSCTVEKKSSGQTLREPNRSGSACIPSHPLIYYISLILASVWTALIGFIYLQFFTTAPIKALISSAWSKTG